MIISHKHQFIFMHARKCAGSSMEVMLNSVLGQEDIQIGSWHEVIQNGGYLNKKALKDALLPPSSWPRSLRHLYGNIRDQKGLQISRVANAAIKRQYRETLGSNPACPIAQSVAQLVPEAWQQYFKFSFVRNPYDFEISDYFWRTNALKEKVDFKEFLRRKLDHSLPDVEGVVPYPPTNWPIYSVDDEVVLDYIGRFENLSEHVHFISERLNLPIDLNSVPKAKSGTRRPVEASSFFDAESKKLVSLLHQRELDFFGYEFPS